MVDVRPLRYSLVEIHSALPTGWNLVDPTTAGRWDARRKAWTVDVHDGADQTWVVRIPARAATKEGRLPALRQAMQEIYRNGVGKDGFFG